MSAAFLLLIVSSVATAHFGETRDLNAHEPVAPIQKAARDAHVRRDLKVKNDRPLTGKAVDTLPSDSDLARFSLDDSDPRSRGVGSPAEDGVTAGRELRNYGLLHRQGRRKPRRQPPGQVTLKPYQDKLPIPKTIDVTKAKGGSDPDLTMGVHSVKWVRRGQLSVLIEEWRGS